MAKKPRSIGKAREAARSGEIEVAIEALQQFLEKGDQSAAASLAEIFAFQGRWEEVVVNAAQLVAHPDAVYAGNVFDDMVRLLALAGHESGNWESIKRAAQEAKNGLEGGRNREVTILGGLIAYADRAGAPPHELISIFEVAGQKETSADENAAKYQEAVRDVDSIRPDLKAKADQKAAHFFSLAVAFDHKEEAIRLYREIGKQLWFDNAVFVAKALVGRGEAEEAWNILKDKLGSWDPVDDAQVEPVELLGDRTLRSLMTPERCAFVLQTKKG